MADFQVVALPGLPEFHPGDDLGAAVVAACAAAGVHLADTDVLVIASKVVAKVENRFVPAEHREAALAAETVRQVAARWLPDAGRAARVVQTRSGPVLVAAGIDSSDVPTGPDGEDRVLLLPAEPDGSARRLRAGIERLAGVRPAVLITDTAGRPWRQGVADFALGAAGLMVLDDRRGTLDRDGRVMNVTVRALADELAAVGDLAKDKAAGTPVAIIRGLGHLVTDDDGPGALGLVRFGPTDWFALGSDEAVRAALGLRQGPGADDVTPVPLEPFSGTVTTAAVTTALVVATAGPRWPDDAQVRVVEEVEIHVTGSDFSRGTAVERILTALHTVRLAGDVLRDADGADAAGLSRIRVSPARDS